MRFREASIQVSEVFFEDEVGVACGGRLEVLVQAAKEDEELRVLETEGVMMEAWTIKAVGDFEGRILEEKEKQKALDEQWEDRLEVVEMDEEEEEKGEETGSEVDLSDTANRGNWEKEDEADDNVWAESRWDTWDGLKTEWKVSDNVHGCQNHSLVSGWESDGKSGWEEETDEKHDLQSSTNSSVWSQS